jgi:hypothetical protein
MNDIITESPNVSSLLDIPTDTTPSPEISLESTPSINDSGFNIGTIVRYGLIILILAFLGINLFHYLGIATETTTSVLGPVFRFLGVGAGETIKQTVDVSAEGTKKAVDVVSGTVDDAVTLLEKAIDKDGIEINKFDSKKKTTQKALEKAEKKYKATIPEPDEAGSVTQKSKTLTKPGYCYIGEDRGFRSCIQVAYADECMSGEIFPSRDVCVNPNLRE